MTLLLVWTRSAVAESLFCPARLAFPTEELPRSVAIADLNGDHVLDLVATIKGVAVLLGLGDGTFVQAGFYGVNPVPGSVAIGDLNADRMPDLAVANENSDNVAGAMRHYGPRTVLVASPRPAFFLAQNRPNSFATATEIEFSVPASGPVTLGIYDVIGRLVRLLIAEDAVVTGEHRLAWDGRGEDGRRVASGTYVYRLSVGNQEIRRKLQIVR